MNGELSPGAIAAATPEAAAAGAEILADGGNAVDAAVAVSLALGVSEPAGSGIGGQSTLLLHGPGVDPVAINGSSFAPAAVPPDASLGDLSEHRATTIPTNLRALDFAHRRFGSGKLSWSRLVEPAIRLAEEGHPLGEFRRRALLRHAQAIRANGVATRILLGADGRVPQAGAIMRQPLLAKTLRRIAERGADDFYRGEIAREIAAEMGRAKGWLSAGDLANLGEPPVLPALGGTYRDWDVFTLPPPAAGWVVLLALNILEQAPEGELAVEGPARLVWLANALGAAHQRRVMRPPPDLVHYEKAVAGRTSKDRARTIARSLPRYSGETTHFSLADGAGLVVAVTQSLNSYYGARTAHSSLGFLYNDYMREFVSGDEDHPFALRPGAMPYSSMSATVLGRDGRPELALGSPGDDRIISAVVQVASHWVDIGQGIEAAVGAHRVHALRGGELLVEHPPEDASTLLALERHGHVVYHPVTSLEVGELNPYFGGVHAVALDDGAWQPAADPRRDGVGLLAPSVSGA